VSLRDEVFKLDPVLWCQETLNLEPDPWQSEVLRSNSKRILLLCSRQAGKSFTCGLLATHTAIYQPGSLILCISPTLRQSSELLHTISRIYGTPDQPVPSTAESALKIELKNGSRIICLPGKEQNVRGYAGVSLLIIDESARVPDDMYFSLRPFLAVSRGRMVCSSTPFGKRGWYFREWTEGLGWERHQITALQCPRITPEFLDQERKSMPQAAFDAEYMCVFGESTDSVFGYDLVAGAVSKDIEPLDCGVEEWQISMSDWIISRAQTWLMKWTTAA